MCLFAEGDKATALDENGFSNCKSLDNTMVA
jgi:hypothetical protein